MTENKQLPDTPKLSVVASVRWNATARVGCELVRFASSLVVASLLVPEDYGLMGMAMVVIGFVSVIQTLGFSAAIVQKKAVSEELANSAFIVNIAFGSVLTASLCLLSPAISALMRDSRIAPIFCALSFTFALTTPGLVPSALLTRNLAFNVLAVIELTTSLLQAAVAIVLAWFEFGVWSLVWASLSYSLATTVLLLWLSPWRPAPRLVWSSLREVLGFGLNYTGDLLFRYLSFESDKFLIGAFLGATSLGFYSLATRLQSLPRQLVFQVAGRVLLPTLSRLQESDEDLTRAYLRSTSIISLFIFPIVMGLACVARPFILVALGPKWLPSLPLLYILLPVGAIQPLETLTAQVFLSKGKANWLFRWTLIRGTVLVAAFAFGLYWDVWGVAIGYLLVTCAFFLPTQYLLKRLVSGFSVRSYCLCLLPHVWHSALMAFAVTSMVLYLASIGLSDHLTLAMSVPLGATLYLYLVVWRAPDIAKDVIQILPPRLASFAIKRLRLLSSQPAT